MKIALAQMEVLPGQPRKNLETMLRMIEQAKLENVNLVAFPEMCLGGYLLGDQFLEDRFCEDLMEYNQDILRASEGITVAYGNIFVDQHLNERVDDHRWHPNKDGRVRKYNAAYVVQNGTAAPRIKETKFLPPGVQPKTLLPNYRIFDDERYFFSSRDHALDFGIPLEELLQPFLIEVDGKKVPVGLEVCEDLWCEDYRLEREALNPTKMIIKNGAQYVINISASPWTFGKNSARDKRIQFLKQESGTDFVPFFYVNCTGVQNNGKNLVTFDGGFTVYNTEGKPLVFSKAPYKEELIIFDTENVTTISLLRVEKSEIAQKYDAIVEGIRHMPARYIVGMSGGIDSSVVAALLVQALGREKVLGVNLPTRFNSDKTKNAARYVAEKLGIGYVEIPIGEFTALNEKFLLEYSFDGKAPQLTPLQKGNIAAKIRGTAILSNLAAQYGARFTNNSNKLEIALGYATLYGDVNGALAPLGDLLKTEIFELARYLNREIFCHEVIPETLLPDELYRFRKDQIEPSAELEQNQVDPMKFGYHDALLKAMTDYKINSAEDFMQWYREGTLHSQLGISPQLMERWGVDNPTAFIKDLEWFLSSAQKAVFKRIQAPPIIITSKTAYGYDRRESILPYEETREHTRLKNQILTEMETYLPREEAAQNDL